MQSPAQLFGTALTSDRTTGLLTWLRNLAGSAGFNTFLACASVVFALDTSPFTTPVLNLPASATLMLGVFGLSICLGFSLLALYSTCMTKRWALGLALLGCHLILLFTSLCLLLGSLAVLVSDTNL